MAETTTSPTERAADDRGAPAAHLEAGGSEITNLAHRRFDRALAALEALDGRARVALDTKSGLANGVDGLFEVDMPAAARALPGSDRAAAAAVLFLDEYGPLFGIAGWHVLSPRNASPLGESIWFSFEATTPEGKIQAHVCAAQGTVTHVRIER